MIFTNFTYKNPTTIEKGHPFSCMAPLLCASHSSAQTADRNVIFPYLESSKATKENQLPTKRQSNQVEGQIFDKPFLPSDDDGDDDDFDEVYERDPDAVVDHESPHFKPERRWQRGFFMLNHVAWDLLGNSAVSPY